MVFKKALEKLLIQSNGRVQNGKIQYLKQKSWFGMIVFFCKFACNTFDLVYSY